jgi:hypothetical protein
LNSAPRLITAVRRTGRLFQLKEGMKCRIFSTMCRPVPAKSGAKETWTDYAAASVCPSCERVCLSEELARGKVADVEKELEDK